MNRALILIFVLILPIQITAQELSVNDLYHQTLDVSQLINRAKHLEALERADEIIQNYSDFENRTLYFTYLYMYKAEAYRALGDILISRHYSEMALRFAQESNHIEIRYAIQSNLIGLEIDKHNYRFCFEQALKLLRDSSLHPTIDQLGIIWNNLAISAVKIGDYAAADSLFPKLFDLASNSADLQEFDHSLPFRNYGLYLMQVNLVKQAEPYFHQALRSYQEAKGDDHYETARSLLYLGGCKRSLGEMDSAFHYINRAIQILEPDPLQIRPAQYELLLVQAYRDRAFTQYCCFVDESLSPQPDCINKAYRDIGLAQQRIEYLMKYYSASESGFSFAEIVRPVYDLAYQICMDMYHQEQDVGHLNKALLFSDKAKRMSLMARNQVFTASNISKDLERSTRNFYRTRVALSGLMNTKEREIRLSDYAQQKTQLDSLYGSVSGSQLLVGEAVKNREVKVISPLLSYHDQDSVFRVVYIDRGNATEYSIPKTEHLLLSIQRLKGILYSPRTGNYSKVDLTEYIELASYLGMELLGPVQEQRKGILYIQPDGELNGLPFEVMILPDPEARDLNDNGSFRGLPFVLCDHTIFYPSTIEKHSYEQKFKHPRILILHPDDTRGLSGAQTESQYLRKLFNGRTSVSLEEESDIIHFIGHSRVDLKDPYRSSLGNGLIWTDILSMDNREKWVYLNSCETGLGLYNSGEGLLSLGWAFLISGAKVVVETYWQAPEHPSVEIAKGFYSHKGFNQPARALQKAKLQYLEQARDGMDHPHYWAGILVQGQVSQSSGRITFVIIPIAIILLALFAYFWISRKK